MPGREGPKGDKGDQGNPGFQGESGHKGDHGVRGLPVCDEAVLRDLRCTCYTLLRDDAC